MLSKFWAFIWTPYEGPRPVTQNKKKEYNTEFWNNSLFIVFGLSSVITLFFKCEQYTYFFFYFKMKTLIDFQLKLFATTYDTKELSLFLSVNKISDTSKTFKYFTKMLLFYWPVIVTSSVEFKHYNQVYVPVLLALLPVGVARSSFILKTFWYSQKRKIIFE